VNFFLARNGLECCLKRVGPYFVLLFPFPCISPISDYRYRTCAIVAEQIGLTGGLYNFDPETLPSSVSKGFLRSLPTHNRHIDFPFHNTLRYSP